jgi:hypothetical protein
VARDENEVTGILDATIGHLRAYCPPFAGRVAGAADFARGLQDYNENMALPAAYVVPLDQESEGNRNMTGLFQFVRKTVGVVVELDARNDRRGQDPAMTYDAIEAAIFASILNWAPVECRIPNSQGYWFSGGRFLDLDRARLFYQWEFAITYQLTEEDGWHEPDPLIDLTGIELDIYHPVPPWEMPPPDGHPPAVIVKLDTDPPHPEPYPNGGPQQ